MQGLMIDPCSLPPECKALRQEVRAFLAEAMEDIPPAQRNPRGRSESPCREGHES